MPDRGRKTLTRSYRESLLFWQDTQRRFIIAASLIVAVLFVGTLGYVLLEHWAPIDAFYMTVITIATVGFQEVGQLSQAGRLFTILLIFLGIGTASYSIGMIAALFVEGHMFDIIRGRKMVKEITSLRDHLIVCGYGKIGREVCDVLANENEIFIVIDSDQDKIDMALEKGYLAAVGDATDDDILLKSGIKQARGLISAISDDSANIYLVLTARALNDRLHIVARGVGTSYQKKMQRAGANRVVSPFEIGARRMAALLMRPAIVDFLEALSPVNSFGLRLDRIEIGENSPFNGVRLDKSYIKRDTGGAMVLGIEKKGQRMIINPPGSTKIGTQDTLLVIGSDEQLERLLTLSQ